jgi:drug/metabolite transporter (DMT)-like permease
VAHTAAVVLWFFAMTRIPIAEVSALNYLSPIYVTLGAAFFLGERFALRRLLAVLAGLLGAVIILRPGMRELSSGHIAMLFTALGFAASYLIAKRMTTEASPTVVVVMLSVTVTIGLAPLAALDWVTPTGAQLFWLTLVAVFATAGHFTMTLAFQAAPVAVTQPMTFLQLVWAILLGAAFFGEPVDPYVVLGGTLIIAAVSFIAWREARVKETP